MQRILDSITAPAYVRNSRLDLLAANTLGYALYAPAFEDTIGVPNMSRFVFLNPRASEFFHDWESIANDAVAILRAAAGHDPYDKRLSDLIGELSTRSDEFRIRWAAHSVKLHRTGAKRLHHPIVGDLALDYEALELPGDTGQRILIYSAEPASPSRQALDLLASWAKTPMSPPADEPADERLTEGDPVGVQPKKPTVKGPADWFTGDVWIDSIVQPHDHSTLNVGSVHFAPGARTAWHSHDGGQTIYVTEGRGLAQSRGEDIVELRPGDVHLTPDGQEHWHGAHHEHFMTHISITHGPATWGDHITDAECGEGT